MLQSLSFVLVLVRVLVLVLVRVLVRVLVLVLVLVGFDGLPIFVCPLGKRNTTELMARCIRSTFVRDHK